MRVILLGLLLVHLAHTSSDCVDNINKYRALHAKGYKIANMNKLEHNNYLELMIRKSFDDDGCAMETKFRPDVKMVYLTREDTEEGLQALTDPNDSHAACMTVKCARTEKDQLVVAIWNGMIHGKPGSQCPNGRQANSDGLCALPEKKKGYSRKRLFGRECLGYHCEQPIEAKRDPKGTFFPHSQIAKKPKILVPTFDPMMVCIFGPCKKK